MKLKNLLLTGSGAVLLVSCGSQFFLLDTFVAEESTLNMVKITNEASNSVLIAATNIPGIPARSAMGYCLYNDEKDSYSWGTPSLLSLSPEGNKIAYLSTQNGQSNIMVRSTGAQSTATQRTFRNVSSFTWGPDNQLYFTDNTGTNSYISSVDAIQGSMMKQLTNGNVNDFNPAITSDGKLLFFTRADYGGPAVWSLNREDGTLTSCARGFNPCVIPGNNNAFYCARNNAGGRSEIWFVDFVNGEETLIASDINHGLTNPVLSPDGKWLLCVGNTEYKVVAKGKGGKDKKVKNLDIFVVKTDGTNLTQLTFHPSTDCSPAWSKDGRSIYFVSDRANKDRYPNIWKMNFNIY